MKKLAKILSLMLVALMLLAMFAACADEAEENETAATTKKPQEVDTKPPTQQELSELEIKDLKKAEYLMLWPEEHTDGHFTHNELDCDAYDSDVINQAVFDRNTAVETTYNAILTVDLMFCSRIPDKVRLDHSAGDSEYDVVATNLKFMTPIALENALTNFDDLEYYDETQEWWNHDLMQDMAIANQKFFAAGDIIYSDDFYPYCMYANLALAEDSSINADFYNDVRTKTWTLEKVYQYAKQAKQETSGDDVHTVADQQGLVANENFARAIYYSAGTGMINLDSEGYPTWAMTNSHGQSVLDKVLSVWNDDGAFFTAHDDIIAGLNHAQLELQLFNTSKTLFLAEELIISERIRNSSSPLEDFAILPMPLYEEGGEYISVLNDAVVLSVPTRCARKDDVSLILSAMGRESVNTLTPAFFELILTYRYAGNPDSAEMLSIILNSTVAPDVATIQDWGDMMQGFKTAVVTGDSSFSGVYTSNINVAMGKLDEYITQLEKVELSKGE